MKKKILAILLSTVLSASFVSCAKNTDTNNENNLNNTSSISNDNNNQSDNSSKEPSSENTNETTNKDENEDEVVSKNAKIYYYDVVTDKIVYLSTAIEIKNKEVATALLNELKKAPTEDISAAINEDITLKSANVDKNNDSITLDFSSNFVEAQNLGSGVEKSTLQAIANTFGEYFGVTKVIITLDGKSYSSGHILMNEGEGFTVNLNDVVELNK